MEFNYRPKPSEKLKSDYSRRKKQNNSLFPEFADFEIWYNNQERVCYYCGIKEEEVQEIVVRGILTSNRFPQNGQLGQGRSRGMWLEVDRIAPKGSYSNDNCVLCCYFCNNDKSDIFHGDDYKLFSSNRAGFLRQKLNQ